MVLTDRAEGSWGALRGECAIWLSDDTLCGKKLHHDGNHRGYDPNGSGRWIEYDPEGNEVGRSKNFDWPKDKVKEPTPVPFAPVCDGPCGAPLEQMGAIVLGPPDADGRVRKYHLCPRDYQLITHLMDWRG